MTSVRKLKSNKINASRSTGPRTPGGKLRSRNNARRHGLATPVENDSQAAAGIERLAAVLAEDSDDFGRIEQSRIVAECHFDLRRIRAARFNVFFAMGDLEKASGKDFEDALQTMVSIGRYETRAWSKRKRAVRIRQASK
jgi:hypothetical protein